MWFQLNSDDSHIFLHAPVCKHAYIHAETLTLLTRLTVWHFFYYLSEYICTLFNQILRVGEHADFEFLNVCVLKWGASPLKALGHSYKWITIPLGLVSRVASQNKLCSSICRPFLFYPGTIQPWQILAYQNDATSVQRGEQERSASKWKCSSGSPGAINVEDFILAATCTVNQIDTSEFIQQHRSGHCIQNWPMSIQAAICLMTKTPTKKKENLKSKLCSAHIVHVFFRWEENLLC